MEVSLTVKSRAYVENTREITIDLADHFDDVDIARLRGMTEGEVESFLSDLLDGVDISSPYSSDPVPRVIAEVLENTPIDEEDTEEDCVESVEIYDWDGPWSRVIDRDDLILEIADVMVATASIIAMEDAYRREQIDRIYDLDDEDLEQSGRDIGVIEANEQVTITD